MVIATVFLSLAIALANEMAVARQETAKENETGSASRDSSMAASMMEMQRDFAKVDCYSAPVTVIAMVVAI